MLLVCVLGQLACARTKDDAPPSASVTATLNRSTVPAGGPLDVTYTFTVPAGAPALPSDDWVFVHLLDRNNELLLTDDHSPEPPTGQWRAAAPVSYTRTIFLPRLSLSGPLRVEVGLFSRTTGERVALAGQNKGMRSYEVATFDVAPDAGLPIVFGDGWYDPESETQGHDWHWSRKESRLAFRNPRVPVTLFLRMDQPVTALPTSQVVDVQGPSGALETFTLKPGTSRISKLALTPAQLGSSDMVEVVLRVDQTFVPAAMAQLKSSDTRELGIRLDDAFVETK